MTSRKTRTLSLLLTVIMLLSALAVLPVADVAAAGTSYHGTLSEGAYNFALGQVVHATSDYVNPEGFFNAAFLVDGDWNTYTTPGDRLGWHNNPYESIGETTPADITVTLDGIYLLEEIVLKPQKWSNGKAFPRDYRLQVSLDGKQWTTVAEGKDVNASAASNTAVVPIVYPVNTVQLKYFRIHITRNSAEKDPSGAYYSGIGELELMGTYDETAPGNKAVELNKSALRMQPGESDALRLIRAADKVQWSSDDPTVATVDETGRVKAVAFGETTVRVKTAKGNAACTVLVDDYSVLDNLMITTFRSPSKPHLTPETYDLLAAAGFTNIQNEWNTSVNTVEDNLLMAQYAYERGMYITASIGDWRDGFAGLSYKAVQDRVSVFSHLPGVGGIYILDEPYNANPYAGCYQPIKDLMPHADIHLNFLPLYSYPNAKTYSAQINDFYQLTGGRLDYLMYDHYPFNWTNGYMNEASWFENLDVVRRLGLKVGAKTGTFILSISMRNGYRRPTGEEIRYEMYTAMAYGYKQLAYFCWETPNEIDYGFGPAIVDTEGKPTEIYEPVKEVNNEALKLGPTLMRLECVEPYNVGAKCGYDRALPADFFLQPGKGAQLVISHMRDPETDEDYAFIVNRERYKEQTVTLTPSAAVPSMKEVSNKTGKLEDVPRNADGTYTVTLRPGAGRLFKMPDTCNYAPSFAEFAPKAGENLAAGGNVRAAASVGAEGFYMAYANDGMRFTGREYRGWDSTPSADRKSWLYVDMGGETMINRVDLYPFGTETTFGEGFPTDFTIDVSTDGAHWTTVKTVHNCPRPTSAVPVYRFDAVNARYVRVNITGMQKVGGEYRARLSEVEIYLDDGTLPPPEDTPYVVPEAPLGSNLATARDTEIIASSGENADLIRDGKTDTAAGWCSATHTAADAAEWIGYDFGAPQMVEKITVHAVKNGVLPAGLRVEISLDGKDWRTVCESDGSTSDRRREIVPDSAVEARYVRILATKLASPSGQAPFSFGLSELEVIAGERVNKEPLNTLIAEANKLNFNLYTKDSAGAVAAAIAVAQNTVAQAKVTNATLKSAYDALAKAVSKLTLLADIATENIAPGKKVLVSSAYQEAPYWLNAGINDGRKFDVDEADGRHCGWSSNIHVNPEPEGAEEWIGFDLGEAYNLLRMVVYPAKNGANHAQVFPLSYCADVSDDGKNWTTVCTVENVTNADKLEPHTLHFGDVKARYIRFRGTVLQPLERFGYMMQLSEIELYGYTDADAPDIPEDPIVTDPADTDPTVTDPTVTDPTVTDPAVTDPAVTDPADTDPAETGDTPTSGCRSATMLAVLPLLAGAALVCRRKRREETDGR